MPPLVFADIQIQTRLLQECNLKSLYEIRPMEDYKTAITEAVQHTIELPEFDFEDLEFS
jgi:hypothetical protein